MAKRNVGCLHTSIYFYEVRVWIQIIYCCEQKILQLQLFVRQHIPHLSPLDEDVGDKILKLDTEMTLLFGELHTDKWLENKSDTLSSPT